MNLLIHQLRKVRTSLIRAYIAHVVWFSIMCTFAALRWSQHGLKWSVLLTLATVPPVLIYTVRVHRLCRAIDPAASTVGWIPVLITTVVLSPFESGLVLPVKNLLAANAILKRHAANTLRASPMSEQPGPEQPGPEQPKPEQSGPDARPLRSG